MSNELIIFSGERCPFCNETVKEGFVHKLVWPMDGCWTEEVRDESMESSEKSK